MATYTSNYGWTKPDGNDQVDIGVLNNNLDGQDGVIHDAFLNMAEPFSELSTYSVGNIVLYGTKTYKCRVAVTTAGSWTGATNWDEYKLSEGGSSTGGEVKNLDNGMLSHSTDSSYITVNLDVALTAGKEYKITIRDPYYNYVDTKQITWTATRDVIFEGNGGGQYKIQLTQTTASLYNYSGQGWRDIYCDIISDFETVTAAQTTYDNTDSGLSATDVKGAIDELATTPRGYKVIATFTGDGVKTYGDIITAFLPYISQADLLIDANNIFYPRNNVTYSSINISRAGSVDIYTIRLDANNPYWKVIIGSSGSDTNYISQVVPSERVIQLCKKL